MGFRSIELKAPAMEAKRASEIEIREKERGWAGFRGGGGESRDASSKFCHGGHELRLRERERERERENE